MSVKPQPKHATTQYDVRCNRVSTLDQSELQPPSGVSYSHRIESQLLRRLQRLIRLCLD